MASPSCDKISRAIAALHERGVPDVTGDSPERALALAAAGGYDDVVTLLLAGGADIHAENDLPLLRAAEKGYVSHLPPYRLLWAVVSRAAVHGTLVRLARWLSHPSQSLGGGDHTACS